MAKIFINYRTSDEMFAAALLEEALAARFGKIEVFRDSNAIPPASDFRRVLWPALARVSVMIVVIGPRWLDTGGSPRRRIDDPDDYVREEIALALKIGIPVLPVLVGDVEMPSATTLPDRIRDLASCQYLRLGGRTARKDTAHLVDAVVELLEPPAATTRASRSEPTTSPDGRQLVMIAGEGSGAGADWAVGRIVTEALVNIGIAETAIASRSSADGVLLQVPSTHAAAIAAGLVGALSTRLAEFARLNDPDHPLRLRIAIHHAAEADAAGLVRQLVGAPALRETLDAATAARVALVVSDAFFALAVREQQAVDASTYLAADLGDGLTGWVHVPGYPAPPGLSARRPTHDRDGSVPPPNGRVHQVNLGTVIGGFTGTHTGPTTYNFGDRTATR